MTDQNSITEPARKMVWSAEENNPILCENIRNALREVYDPELGLNIIQLGLIRDVLIEGKNTVIKMILTTPFCPYGPSLIESTQQKAQQAINSPVHIDLGMEPWDFSMMEEGLAPDWGIY